MQKNLCSRERFKRNKPTTIPKHAVTLEMLYISDFTHQSCGAGVQTYATYCFKPGNEEWEQDMNKFIMFVMEAWMKMRQGLLVKQCTQVCCSRHLFTVCT